MIPAIESLAGGAWCGFGVDGHVDKMEGPNAMVSVVVVGDVVDAALAHFLSFQRIAVTLNLGLTLAAQTPQLCLLGRQKSLTVAHPAGFLEEGNDGLSQAHLLILLGLLHEGLHQPTQ